VRAVSGVRNKVQVVITWTWRYSMLRVPTEMRLRLTRCVKFSVTLTSAWSAGTEQGTMQAPPPDYRAGRAERGHRVRGRGVDHQGECSHPAMEDNGAPCISSCQRLSLPARLHLCLSAPAAHLRGQGLRQIGIMFHSTPDGVVTVDELLPGSPAANSKVFVRGDIILEVCVQKRARTRERERGREGGRERHHLRGMCTDESTYWPC